MRGAAVWALARLVSGNELYPSRGRPCEGSDAAVVDEWRDALLRRSDIDRFSRASVRRREFSLVLEPFDFVLEMKLYA